MKKYRREVIRFNSEIIGTYEEGVACESLYKWMGNVWNSWFCNQVESYYWIFFCDNCIKLVVEM